MTKKIEGTTKPLMAVLDIPQVPVIVHVYIHTCIN